MQVAARRGALLEEARAELDRALKVGDAGPFSDRVFGDYRLAAVIGKGAMGDVYEASHVDTGELAAVKVLPTRALGDPRTVERFMREAKAASALESAHVVRVLASSSPSDPLPYLIMERLIGRDLAQELRLVNRLPLSEVVELVEQIGSVIDLARDKGIVHRDIKPQNIYLLESEAGRNHWKLLDFGVAALSDHGGTLTQGHVVGTPAYMAPEQARSANIDHRTDLHALTAVVYRCITGQPAFAGRDIPALLYDVVHLMPERPSALVDVPEDVDHVLAIGMAKTREDRFASGAELAQALRAASRGELPELQREHATALIARHRWGVRR
jgi:serine/threonine-protein kinase